LKEEFVCALCQPHYTRYSPANTTRSTQGAHCFGLGAQYDGNFCDTKRYHHPPG
jgi:hypothetical protein